MNKYIQNKGLRLNQQKTLVIQIIFIVLSSLNCVNGQQKSAAFIMNEDFVNTWAEPSPPSGSLEAPPADLSLSNWSNFQLGNSAIVWERFKNGGFNDSEAARHRSDAVNKLSIDSWLISPPINIDGGKRYLLEFWESITRSSNYDLTNSFSEVLISTGSGNAGSNDFQSYYISDPSKSDEFTQIILEFPTDETIYIAFVMKVNKDYESHFWWLDEVAFGEAYEVTLSNNNTGFGKIFHYDRFDLKYEGAGTYTFFKDEDIEFYALPKPGNTFDKWIVNSVDDTNPSIKIAINTDFIIDAIFTSYNLDQLWRQHRDDGSGGYDFSAIDEFSFTLNDWTISNYPDIGHSVGTWPYVFPDFNIDEDLLLFSSDNFNFPMIDNIKKFIFYGVAIGWTPSGTETFDIEFFKPNSNVPTQNDWGVPDVSLIDIEGNFYYTGHNTTIGDNMIFRIEIDIENSPETINLSNAWFSVIIDRPRGDEFYILKSKNNDLNDSSLSDESYQRSEIPAYNHFQVNPLNYNLMFEIWGDEKPPIFTWTGDDNSTTWDENNNWSPEWSPKNYSTAEVIIPDVGANPQPLINTAETIQSLTISDDASVNLLSINGSGNLTVTGDAEIEGDILVDGTLDINGTTTFTGGDTKSISSAGGSINFADVVIDQGILSLPSVTLNVSGNWSATSGTFEASGGTVDFSGTNVDITANTSGSFFNNLTFSNATEATITGDFQVNGIWDIDDAMVSINDHVKLGDDTHTSAEVSSGNGRIDGTLRQYVTATLDTYDYPLGTSAMDRTLTIEYTNAPTAGYLDVKYHPFTTEDFSPFDSEDHFLGNTYSDLQDYDGYPEVEEETINTLNKNGVWEISPADGEDGVGTGEYSATFSLTGMLNIDNPNRLRMVKTSDTSPADWDGAGTFDDATNDEISITGINTYSYWALGSNDDNNPLPISLYSFDASCNGDGSVAVEWVTASETNNSHFFLYRAYEDGVFEKIARIDGAGDSNTKKFYAYQDTPSAHAGMVYYRISQHDYDGKSETFDPVAVQCAEVMSLSSQLEVFPNPAHNYINVVMSSPRATTATLTILSTTGRSLLAPYTWSLSKGINQHRLMLDNLPQGMYIVQVQSGDQVVREKLVVRR